MTAISAIRKYHVVDKITGTPIGQHPLVTIATKSFWQQRPPIPRYHGTYDVTNVLRFIENLGDNEKLTLKQFSEKTAFQVAFSNLSRYCLALFSSLNIFISPFSLTVLLRVSSVLVSEEGVHDGLDGAMVEIASHEKVTSISY